MISKYLITKGFLGKGRIISSKGFISEYNYPVASLGRLEGMHLITKGYLEQAVTVSTKGYIVVITIEEEPVIREVKIPGGRSYKKVIPDKKKIRVTAEINGLKYIETVEVNKNAKITAKNVKIQMGPKPKIIINI